MALMYYPFYVLTELSLVTLAQMVKNLPAMQETWVQSLGWEEHLEKEMATQYSCLENPHGQRSLAGYSPWGCKSIAFFFYNVLRGFHIRIMLISQKKLKKLLSLLFLRSV